MKIAATTRATIRCPHCNLNQFLPEKGCCRRCKQAFKKVQTITESMKNDYPSSAIHIGAAIKSKRINAGMTQNVLAGMMGTTRAYVSAVEREQVVPSINSLETFARALRTDVAELFLELRHFTSNRTTPIAA
jgi:DNA-binding XRE family transcriptional regulator